MENSKRDEDRGALELEIGGSGHLELLRKLQTLVPSLRGLDTWKEALDKARAEVFAGSGKEPVIRTVLQIYRMDGDARWPSILLAIFWQALEVIHHQKREWNPDADELWQDIATMFLQVVTRIDVGRRRSRLAKKILLGTVHDLFAEYQLAWNQNAREHPTDIEDIKKMLRPVEDTGLATVELCADQEAQAERYRGYMRRGWITKGDCHLLIATRTGGQSLSGYSQQMGMKYQTAKKRRQRAEAAIRRRTGAE